MMAGDGRFEIDPDIRRARTPPKSLYTDPAWYERQRERVFPRTWHYVSHGAGLDDAGCARPFVLLEGCLDEPLLLVREPKGVLHCLSNVCTHRGNLIVEGEWKLDSLRCRYHGRRFHLDGTFAYMPGFDGAENFPTERDYLPRAPVAAWRRLVFAGLRPELNAEEMIAPVEQRLAGLSVTDWRFDVDAGRDYVTEANWALYCDNALEGFHTPHIHHALSERGDVHPQRVELWDSGSVRIGEAAPGEPVFELPRSHPDHGDRVAAFYFWLFPGTFLNVYPWGLSLYAVEPLGPDRTRIRHRVFIGDTEQRPPGQQNDFHRLELEDEAVIQSVQRGMGSQLFRGGRYSPQRERAVHHFHRLLSSWMAGGTGRS